MEHTAILLWGETPGVGKNTVARIFCEYGYKIKEFKARLVLDTYVEKVAGRDIDFRLWKRLCSDRTLKDTKLVALDGRSPRDLLIETGAEYRKKQGDDLYARTLVTSIDSNTVIPDLRFQVELSTVKDYFYGEVAVIKVIRRNNPYALVQDAVGVCNFDSVTDYAINNSGSLDNLYAQVDKLAKDITCGKFRKRA